MKKIKILIADDHEILRFGVSTYLASADDVDLVGEASTGEECIELFKKTDPDLCILDIDMPGTDGIEATRAIRELDSDVKILILSMHIDKQIMIKILQAGIDGYLLKNTEKSDLLKSIRTIMSNQNVFSPSVSRMMTDTFLSNGYDESFISDINITDREHEILELIVDGLTSQEIADKLFISPRTVDTHRSNLMQKLEIKNTAGLVRFALKHNLITSG